MADPTRPGTPGRAGRAARTMTVLETGALTTVQDLGRAGLAHLGVPRSGALDEPALRLANRLVGNDEGTAALETTLTGFRARLDAPATFAVTGATCPVRVDGRAVEFGAAVTAPGGAEVALGPATGGVRSYLAVAGGIEVPGVLGSRSTDLLSGLGPDPLREGDLVPLGEPIGPPRGDWAVPRPRVAVLHLRPGPRDDWFVPGSLAALDGATYVVAPDSNRIALRLRGPVLRRTDTRELPSEGMVLGAVQVPPSGQPVVFLNDHPTTGGYPVIGVVSRADLPVCAQSRPGDQLVLRVI